MRRPGFAAVVASALGWSLALATPAGAQTAARGAGPEPALGRFGAGAALRGLGSDDPRERLRSVERLGALGTDEAIAALLDVLEPGVSRGDLRSAAVRALAPHAGKDDARAALVREVLQAGAARREGRGASDATRGIAALALAGSGTDRALAALGAAVAQGGPAALAARDALLAFPPARLEPLLGRIGPRAPARIDGRVVAPALLVLLGDLGDARALPILRGALGAAAPASRVEAALALARMGDAAALSFVPTSAKGDASARVASAEVQALLGAPGATAAIDGLLRDGDTRVAGLRLARLAPAPGLAGALTLLARTAPPELASDALGALGEAGGAAAAQALGERAAAPGALAVVAAIALGRSPGPAAHDAVEAALARRGGDPARIRRAALAGMVRALALGDEVSGLEEALTALAAPSAAGGADPKGADAMSAAAESAELGVFGLVALGALDPDQALARRPPGSSELRWWGAVARGTLSPRAGSGARRALGEAWLSRGAGGDLAELAAAAGVALLERRIAERVATSALIRITQHGGPAAPLAARELARRDDGSLRAAVDRLLTGVDPAVRAHVALGLGDSLDASSAARLAQVYRDDDDPTVRAAAVRALSRRTEPQRNRILVLASNLDPDRSVRALARAALGGRALADPSPSASEVGVTLVAIEEPGAASSPPWTARARRPDGLTLPLVVPSGGWLVVPGLTAGESALLLSEPASEPSAEPAPRPGAPAAKP